MSSCRQQGQDKPISWIGIGCKNVFDFNSRVVFWNCEKLQRKCEEKTFSHCRWDVSDFRPSEKLFLPRTGRRKLLLSNTLAQSEYQPLTLAQSEYIQPLQMFALSRGIYQTSPLKNFILGSNTTCWCSIALMPSWCISQRQSNQMRGRAPSGNVGSTNWEISERISMLCLNFDNQNISRLNPSYPLDQFTSWKYRIYVSPLIHWTENLQLDSNHFYI